METEIKIRKITAQDIDNIVMLGKGQREFTFSNVSFWSSEQLLRWSENGDDICILAEESGKIIGFSLYAVHLPTGKVTWENLYVIPEYRNKGVGAMLINEGLKLIKDKGYSFVIGCVNATDKTTFVNYLEKFGFKKEHEMVWVELQM